MTLADTSPSVPKPRKSRAKGDGLALEARSWRPAEAIASLDRAPTVTFRLPSGKQMRLSTDRVRAVPAVTPTISGTLGNNAIGLGVWGLFFPKSVNRFLGLECAPQTTQLLFGAREMATGMRLFSDPTDARALWARVAGDALDIAVLRSLDSPSNEQRKNARLALGVVLAVTALDVITAVRMSHVKRNCAQESPR